MAPKEEPMATPTAVDMENLTGISGDETYPEVPARILTDDQIQEFLEHGVLVVPNVLSEEEIVAARQGLHAELAKYGVDHNDLKNTGQHLQKLSSTGGAGGILDLFYPSWRLQVAENIKVFGAMTDLWEATYAHNHPDFQHPFGDFHGKRGFMYINRVCYRVPDHISKMHGKKKSRPMQRSLTPHLDCCPSQLFNFSKDIPRWRPIQCITVLTNNTEPNTGGFEAVRGFHKEFESYFANQAQQVTDEANQRRPQVCLGDFSPMRMQEDRDVIARYEHINCEAGSVIFFDWRIPHANSYKHVGTIPREVVYTGFLPDTSLNRRYVQEQLRRYRLRLLPADHWQKHQGDKRVEEHFSAHHFSALGSRLIGHYPCGYTLPFPSQYLSNDADQQTVASTKVATRSSRRLATTKSSSNASSEADSDSNSPSAKPPIQLKQSESVLEHLHHSKDDSKTSTDSEIKQETAAQDDKSSDMKNEMTEYERKRLENIQRNLEFMKAMGVSTAKIAARTAISTVKPKFPLSSAKRTQPKERLLPVRKSRRIEGKKAEEVMLHDHIMTRWDAQVKAHEERAKLPRRLDRHLTANALNVSESEGSSLLQSIAAGIDDEDDEREFDLKVDATGIKTVDYELNDQDVVKATPERIYSMQFLPRADKIVLACGDKGGNLALWSADQVNDDDDAASPVVVYRPHTLPVTQLHFSPTDATKLLSASFDGSVRSFDLKAAAFSELFAAPKDVGITSMAVAKDGSQYLVSCDDGAVWTVDPRSPSTKRQSYYLHEKKINTVHQHPTFDFCVVTASLDRTVCLWDIRKLDATNSTSEPLVTMPHHRSVNCAYFSPNGAHLVTVGQDNRINLFDTLDARHHDSQNVAPTLSIPHNNQTGRWLTKLHASWDPKQVDQFVIGCMEQPRRLQIFQATRKNPIQELKSEYFNSVHSINVFHPTLPMIAGGNSSGRLCLWRGKTNTTVA